MEGPFVFGSHATQQFFTNRTNEIKTLTNNFIAGTNTMLISPRRWGKSSLVMNVSERMKPTNKNIRFCFIDLFSVRSEEEFYEVYSQALINASESKLEERIKSVRKFFRSLLPAIKLPVDGQNDLELNFEWKQLKRNADDIINLAERICREKKIKLIVCIDEFQNISNFSDSLGFQKKLRAQWQKHQLTTYCLYGSKRQMMAHIFESPAMPFYKFGDVLFLKKIDRKHWIKFIVKQFASKGNSITEEVANEIAGRMEDHPYFVQQLAQEAWQLSDKKCLLNDVDAAVSRLMEKLSILYQREIDQLSNKQINFLKALANGETRFTTLEVLEKYRLGTSGNVIKMKKVLESEELIDSMEPEIQFTDPLFKLWFRKYMMNESC